MSEQRVNRRQLHILHHSSPDAIPSCTSSQTWLPHASSHGCHVASQASDISVVEEPKGSSGKTRAGSWRLSEVPLRYSTSCLRAELSGCFCGADREASVARSILLEQQNSKRSSIARVRMVALPYFSEYSAHLCITRTPNLHWGCALQSSLKYMHFIFGA